MSVKQITPLVSDKLRRGARRRKSAIVVTRTQCRLETVDLTGESRWMTLTLSPVMRHNYSYNGHAPSPSRCKSRSAPRPGCAASPPRRGPRSLVWIARVFRCAGSGPGEIRNAASGRCRGPAGRRTTEAFGCSRPTFYQAQTAFKTQGLPGLVPRKRGPRGAHKLDDAVMAVRQRRTHRRPRPQHAGRCSATFGGALASPSTDALSSAPSGARKKNDAECPSGGRGAGADHGGGDQLRNPAAGRTRS